MLKKKFMFIPVLLIIFLSMTGCDDFLSGEFGAKRTGSLNGEVVNNEKNPIQGVEVSVAGKNATTDSNGLFKIEDLEVGDYSMVLSHEDYDRKSISVSVEEGSNSLGEIKMKSSAVPSHFYITGYGGTWADQEYYKRSPIIYDITSSDEEFNDFNLYRSKNKDENFKIVDVDLRHSEERNWNFQDTTVEWGNTYYYRVTAVKEDGTETELSEHFVEFNLKDPFELVAPENNVIFYKDEKVDFCVDTVGANFSSYGLMIWEKNEEGRYHFDDRVWISGNSPCFEGIDLDQLEPGKYRWNIQAVEDISESKSKASGSPFFFFEVVGNDD